MTSFSMRKKKLPIVVAAMILIVIAASMAKVVNVTSASPDTRIFVDPSQVSNVPLGDNFLVNISISDAPLTYAWEFHLDWDRTLLNVNGIKEGDFLHRWEVDEFDPSIIYPKYPTAITFSPLNESNVEGKILVACSLLGALPTSAWANGSGWLATLNFTVTSTGSTLLNLFDTKLTEGFVGDPPSPITNYYPNEDCFFYNVPLPIHDIRITDVVALPSKVKAGGLANISVTVFNEGTETETITLYVNASTIHLPTTVITLNGTGNSENRSLTYTIHWNTTGVAGEEYLITAYVPPVPDEVDTTDNFYRNRWMLDPTSQEPIPVYTTVTVWWDHDLKIILVTPSVSKVRVGEEIGVSVSVFNQGNFTETFNVTVYADLDAAVIGDEITVGTKTGINLGVRGGITLYFRWNTTGVLDGNYTISAGVPPVPGEVDPNIADNTLVDGTVTVLPLGYPVADFTFSPLKPLVSEPVDFHSSSTDADGYIVSWEWDFNNDGVIDATTENATWTYTATGEYTVKLTVTDNATLTNDVQRLVKVYAVPIASFTFSPQNPASNEAIAFDASASSDPDGAITAYSWDFGDDQTSTGSTVSHSYASFGTYTVTLNVTDLDGFIGTKSLNVNVKQVPTASFTFSPSSPQAFQVITFNASSSTPNGGSITEYFWDFGDDATANETDPITTHSFSPADTYTITLTVTDSEGLDDSATQSIVIGKLSSTTSMNLASTSITKGNSVAITGSINPQRGGVTVMIVCRLSGAQTWSVLSSVTTSSNGQYSYTWTPTAAGTYEVKATWQGDASTTGGESNIQTIAVQDVSTPPISTWMLIAGIVIVIVIAVAVYFLKFRKPKTQETPPTSPP